MDALSSVSNKMGMTSGQTVNSYGVSQTLNDSQNAHQAVTDVRGVNASAKAFGEQASSNDANATNTSVDPNLILEKVNVTEEQDVSELAKQLQESVDKYTKMQKNLRFTTNDDPACRVISVVDTTTDETIKQIPTEEALALMKRMGDLYDELQTPTSSTKEGTKAGTRSLLMDTVV